MTPDAAAPPDRAPAGSLSSRRPLLLRGLASAFLLALTLLAWQRAERLEQDHRGLLASAAGAGLERSERALLERLVRREGDPADARTLAARVLVESAIQRQAAAPAEPSEPTRLTLAADLAREALERQPANAEASWILGATTSLIRAGARDPRLFSLSAEWERPIRRAIELAPHSREPRRMLVGAYLDVWPALSPARREETTRMLREAFADRATFQRLIGPWLEIAGSLDAAAELVPDRSWVWAPFAERAARAHDWRAFVAFDARRQAASTVEVDAALAAAEAGLESGNAGAARNGLDEILANLAPDAAAAPRLERLLSRRPAGPAPEATARAALRWLDWAIPLELLGRPALAPEAIGRLTSLAGGRLTPDQAAVAALAADDLARAELFERRSDSLWSERWAPFLALKATGALARRAPAEARAALEQVHRDYRKRVPWRRLALEVGLPATPLGRERWEATDWIWSEGKARLELDPDRAASGLRLAIEGVGEGGAVLEAVLDGRALAPVILSERAREAVVAVALDPAPHLLELRARAGTVRPAPAVELLR